METLVLTSEISLRIAVFSLRAIFLSSTHTRLLRMVHSKALRYLLQHELRKLHLSKLYTFYFLKT